MDDDDRPRPKGDAASLLAREDLGPYSLSDLAERIELLRTEIVRIEAHRDKVSAQRSAADALFGRKE